MTKILEKANVFKKIMGLYPTGVTIVTTSDEKGNPVGLTVNSFASVSISPLMVLWCIDKNSSSLDAFLQADKYAVHTLSEQQKEACWAFAGKEKDRFSKVHWESSSNGLPIIKDSLGVFECKTVSKSEAGDHIILLGEVIDLSITDQSPLLYYNRNVGPIPEGWPES
ncbi:flavin reductase family protein [Neobacillus muris]|uniref:flavin reductase family protein n=1 Tax=Neobacillus muris TaxID=2941334 RepID=UPI00203C37EF|nr:flavin reductase family protein [Neobacillus muris]